MKIYLTKYVLSYGIMEAECSESKYTPGAVSITHIYHPKWGHVQLTALKNEWAMTKEEARQQAYSLLEKRMKSLDKQIKKLERLVFFG